MSAQLTKKRKAILSKIDPDKAYTLSEAMKLVKEISTVKFDASVDMNIKLGVDPRKANQMVRGSLTLPHGTGKEKKVLVFCTPDKEQEAKDAGADYVGLDDYVKKVQDGWTDVDVVVAMPSVMAKIGRLGRILGPRGLMPNPKTGTVTMEIGKAVTDVKKGKVSFKVDKYGIIHQTLGKTSFDVNKLVENASEFVNTILKLKPVSSKGTYVLSAYISATMSPGIKLDTKSLKA